MALVAPEPRSALRSSGVTRRELFHVRANFRGNATVLDTKSPEGKAGTWLKWGLSPCEGGGDPGGGEPVDDHAVADRVGQARVQGLAGDGVGWPATSYLIAAAMSAGRSLMAAMAR